MADNENTFLNANNIYEEVEGEAGKSLDLEFNQQINLVGIIKGKNSNGEKFIEEAINKGATVIVCSKNFKHKDKKIFVIKKKTFFFKILGFIYRFS
mgnify:CR=1 FL=1